VQRLDLHEVGPRDRDDAEEEEHEQLAEPLVAVGPRAAGVEHAGEDRRGADEQQLPAGGDDEVGAHEHRAAERDVGRGEDLPRRHEPARGHPHGPEPVLRVGAAARVRVVVGEVRPDLDEQRPEQGGEEREGLERSFGGGERGAHEHGRDGGGQRLRPRRHEPDAG
jgi:hypothetical protein